MITVNKMMDLTSRVALITGGGGYVAKVIAETLAELGAELLILDRDEKNVKKASENIQQKFSVNAIPIITDLEDPNFIKKVLPVIDKKYGRLDILINNAAFVGTSDLPGWAVDFQQQSAEVWRRALDVNLTAPFILAQTFAELLKQSKKGSIINIGSIYGVVGPDLSLYEGTDMGNPAAYAASKGGLIQLTRWLATVLAPNVRVNAISPGGLWRNQSKGFSDRYIEKTPLKRMGSEADLKGAVAYFASDLSAYVTGQNLLVDGGWTAL